MACSPSSRCCAASTGLCEPDEGSRVCVPASETEDPYRRAGGCGGSSAPAGREAGGISPGAVEEFSADEDVDEDELREDEFWRAIPAYAGVGADEFHDYLFQVRHTVTTVAGLRETLGDLAGEAFLEDVEKGLGRSTMSLRVSPYILSLIDWSTPYSDPLRIQFLPVASRMMPDHPQTTRDALREQADSPVSGITHRYRDRALFVTLDTCPVYCRCCTRSYAVGKDVSAMKKLHFRAQRARWEQAFAYITGRREVEDVVISGGDVAHLAPEQVRWIGLRLLSIEHVRRLRFASKSPAVIPQKLVSDEAWVRALVEVVERGRRLHKQVALHTHFNHPREITAITRTGLDRLMEWGVTVRNQTVLQRGVNDHPEVLRRLIRRLSRVNVQPYYVFVHDLVPGVEDLRTSLGLAAELEKQVRGTIAGFNTPAFVVDLPGGGGKRDVHSYEYYDREHGISVFASPFVKPGSLLLFFDPLHSLSPAAQERWKNPADRAALLERARTVACLPPLQT